MQLCKSVYINGDFQNGFEVGRKVNGIVPTKIEEDCQEYENQLDRRYLVYVDNKVVASIINVPVMVLYQ